MPVLMRKLKSHEFADAMSDDRMNMKTRGMLATLQSMDVGEKFTIEEMAENVPDGYPLLLSTVRNLENLGYVERVRVYGDRGYLTGSQYFLYPRVDE